jgi:hypothetical protein
MFEKMRRQANQIETELATLTSTATLTPREQADLDRCRREPLHFFRRCLIYDATAGEWLRFGLWPAQAATLKVVHENQLVVILKARQLGLSWLVLGYALWTMLFRPAATVLIFSKRQEESAYLLGDERMRGMYERLPPHLKCGEGMPDATMTWALCNGSIARAFPTTAGDSYTATLAVVDEADLCPDLGKLMRSVKPTIDGGGKMILLSRADKSQPESAFKRIYRGAKVGSTPWKHVFLPWNARPERDGAWYEAQKADILHRTGSLDDLYEQYPESDAQALSPRSLDKRIPSAWLQACLDEAPPLAALPRGAPSIPRLAVYALPREGHRYVIGADPAEGNPTSDDSALCVLDAGTGEQVAELAGRFEPAILASYAFALAVWFNHAGILVERNNHGHAVLLWLREHADDTRRLNGHDGKPGWLSSTLGKTSLYDKCADAFKNGEVVLRSFGTFTQLASIDGSTLRAPDGQHDDKADAFALAVCARIAERFVEDAMPFTFGDGPQRRWGF